MITTKEELKRYRVEQGMNQTVFAHKLGMADSHLSRIEAGHVPISHKTRRLIEGYFASHPKPITMDNTMPKYPKKTPEVKETPELFFELLKPTDTFGERLGRLREYYNLSRNDVGVAIGKKGSAINAYENNRTLPSEAIVAALADFYMVLPGNITFGLLRPPKPKPEPKPEPQIIPAAEESKDQELLIGKPYLNLMTQDTHIIKQVITSLDKSQRIILLNDNTYVEWDYFLSHYALKVSEKD